MASMGVTAVVNYAKTGKKVRGYTDTGVNLIARVPKRGVPSKSVFVRPQELLGLERSPSITGRGASRPGPRF